MILPPEAASGAVRRKIMSHSSTRITTFKYRLYPSKAQEKNLWLVLEVARQFYNMCLSERKWAYELEGCSVGKFEQLAQVKHYKATFPQAQQVHSHVLQVVVADCDKAFAAFFRRVEFARGAGQYLISSPEGTSRSPSGEIIRRRIQVSKTPGYPRFKGRNWFDSFGFKEYGNGFRLDGRRLKVYGIGRIPIRWHRPFEGEIKTLRIIHKAGRWYACFACVISSSIPASEAGLASLREVELKVTSDAPRREITPERELLPRTSKAVGLDMGVSAMYTTSDGEKVDNPAYYRNAQAELRRAQRSLSRKQHGSKNQSRALLRVQRLQEHTANQRCDYAHKLARKLVSEYDLIALEDLQIANMVRNRRLSKSILDSGWGLFRQVLTDKAARAGRELVLVNPAHTSQECSNPNCRRHTLSLKDRWMECACGLSLDRDHNAAINILNRAGWDTSVQPNVEVGDSCVRQKLRGLIRSRVSQDIFTSMVLLAVLLYPVNCSPQPFLQAHLRLPAKQALRQRGIRQQLVNLAPVRSHPLRLAFDGDCLPHQRGDQLRQVADADLSPAPQVDRLPNNFRR